MARRPLSIACRAAIGALFIQHSYRLALQGCLRSGRRPASRRQQPPKPLKPPPAQACTHKDGSPLIARLLSHGCLCDMPAG